MGILYLAPLPIGNLKDITLRGLEVLRKVDFILAEKPRKTLRLLNYYKIEKSVYPYFEGRNERYLVRALEKIKEGKDVAFVSEAGTPGISDPGQKVVAEAVKNGIQVVALPGPSALSLVLSLAGCRFSEAVFYGYLPKKGRLRLTTRIQEDLNLERVLVFFFSPHRLLRDLEFLRGCGAESMVLVKEATKQYEQVWRGSIGSIRKSLLREGKIKGEWTGLVIPNSRA